MSLNLGKRSKFTQSLRRQGSGSTLSSMGGGTQLEEARASLRSQGDTLTDIEYERDELKVSVGKALAERDDARECAKSLQETLETLRRELAEARQTTGHQDGSLQRHLTEIEASIQSERRAWHLTEEAANRSISHLEHERDALSRSLESTQAESLDARAASAAAREARDALREELIASREELRRRVDELGLLEDRRTAVELGLEALRKAAAMQDELVEFMQGRIRELEGALEAERRQHAQVATGSAIAQQTDGGARPGGPTSGVLREEISEPRELADQQRRRSNLATQRSWFDELGEDKDKDSGAMANGPRRRQGSIEAMPGSLNTQRELDAPSRFWGSGLGSSLGHRTGMGRNIGRLLRAASEPITRLLFTRISV
ncbi:hypothetical protein DAEQUDRAFT_740950 [Daedalea quercina L-15889]|uniref:Uncharacterized protein n=1 Tax=Daedalea quercina L-15889 TaxID=1314783 RepID=A0A165LVJ0_9APHY|nr:hypothetical protein DAEQUDRAFT_740950 [Daedalea quercina L-15889]